MSNSSGKITHTFIIYKTFGVFSVKNASITVADGGIRAISSGTGYTFLYK